MKKLMLVTSLLAFTTLPLHAGSQTPDQPTNEEARAIAKQFVGQLQPELQKSMKSNGPVGTIDFCHSKAPQIAHELAQKTGWEINRVSLKPRGANATPDKWEATVLERFNELLAKGENPQNIEFSAIVSMNDEKQFRYMKAIPTGDVCLKCHGTDIAAPVKGAIQKFYPYDAATGYSAGQIRGAFSFSKALN